MRDVIDWPGLARHHGHLDVWAGGSRMWKFDGSKASSSWAQTDEIEIGRDIRLATRLTSRARTQKSAIEKTYLTASISGVEYWWGRRVCVRTLKGYSGQTVADSDETVSRVRLFWCVAEWRQNQSQRSKVLTKSTNPLTCPPQIVDATSSITPLELPNSCTNLGTGSISCLPKNWHVCLCYRRALSDGAWCKRQPKHATSDSQEKQQKQEQRHPAAHCPTP